MSEKNLICDNCGAEFSDSMEACPFCGSENIRVSIRDHLDYLEEVGERTEDLADLPAQRSKKVNRGIGKVAVAALVLIAAVLILVAVTTSTRVSHSKERQDQMLAELEELYVSSDYEGIGEYLNRHDDTWTATFDKYSRLSEIYRDLSTGKDMLENDSEYIKTYQGEEDVLISNVTYGIFYSFRGLALLKEMEEDGYVYDEQQGAEYLREIGIENLRKYARLTDEEIIRGTELYVDYNTDYTEYAKLMIERIRG